MSVDAAIVLLAVLILGNYWLSRSILYPPVGFCAMWLLDLGLYRLDLTPTDTIHSQTISIIAAGALLFSMGAILALYAPKNIFTARFILTRFPPRNSIVKPAVTFFLLCGLFLLFSNLRSLASQGVGDNILQQARSTAGVADEITNVNGLGTYFILWSFYAATLYLLEQRNKSFWLMAGIAFIAGVLSTGRLPIMALICSLTCAQLMMTGRHKFWAALKLARVPLLIFNIMYFGLLFTNKDTSIWEVSVGELVLIIFVGYIVGPTAALDFFLQHPGSYPKAPNHTFKFFLGIAAKLHLIGDQTAPVDAHIFVPFPTNVYTVYRTYISDFGVYGALAVMAMIGLIHTMIYRKARTGSRLGIYFFAVTFYEMLLVIFSDEYASFGAYIDMILFAVIYIFLRSIPMRILPRLKLGYGLDWQR